MNPWSICDDRTPPREWTYPLIFSLVLHLLIFLLAVLPMTLFPRRYHLTPVYSVRLVGAPLPARYPVQSKSVSAKDTGIEAAGKKVVNKKVLANEKLSQQYEEKIKSLALKRESEQRKEIQREEYLKTTLDKLRKQAGQQGSPDMKKALAGIREKIGREGGAIEARTPVAGGSEQAGASILNIYLGLVWDKISSNWIVPPNLLRHKDLETIVVMRIYKNGGIQSAWLEKRSGNIYLDNSAMRAVHLSSPFSPLPPEIRESVLEIGVRFRPKDRG
ncbi:MAG: cell envelope integrity protein TolA [Thermodesulfobacteriota bacterium]|nr:cell envelope integrity protein TolA [Thermodesulfobacteriota bacterium]